MTVGTLATKHFRVASLGGINTLVRVAPRNVSGFSVELPAATVAVEVRKRGLL